MIYTPLHIYSGYSFLKSGLTVEKIVSFLKKRGFSGGAISDLNVMHGAMEFSSLMIKNELQYLVGLDLEIQDDLFSLYAISEKGYLNLSMLSSLISKDQLTMEMLKNYSEDIVCILPTKQSKLYSLFLKSEEDAVSYLLNFFKIFKIFYLGVEIYDEDDERYAYKIRDLASKYDYQTIAFPHIKYEKKEDAITLKILESIEKNEILDIEKLDGDFYFPSDEEMKKKYSDKEIARTNEIAILSTFNPLRKRGHILQYTNDLGLTSQEYLKKLAFEGLSKIDKNVNLSMYEQRLNYELDVIDKMGYNDYFLIVQDFIHFAKTHDISTGPGRGSAAGSLVSYVLDITEVDPLKYDLLFERFLNPERKSMPDIDTDFSDTKRDLVIDYVRSKYGENRVANIITFQTIGAKQSLRDIGRVYDKPVQDIDMLSKLLINPFYSLRESYKKIPAFKKIIDSDSYYLDIVTKASKIEGLPRQSGLHAAGILLNDKPIEKAMPVLVDFLHHYITQYEMNYLEPQGFLKMDFLGLRNLSIIDRILELIKENQHITLESKNIPYEDEKIFDLICGGQVMGLFQLESNGMKRAIKVLKPNCFNDVVALLALFRPGPMENIPTYARRKEGIEKVSYVSDALKDILAPTYGIIVYQEQIIQIVTKMANFSLGEADLFRRAISKKEKAKMAALKEKFIKGAVDNNYSIKEATLVFNHIEKFANYGFNKSHSVCYAIIACKMGYLKAYYPNEFYAAILEFTSGTSDTKFGEYISEIKRKGIKILLPDINDSEKIFKSVNNALLFPLTAIRGLPNQIIDAILKERERGKFFDFTEFVLRMYPYKISEKQILYLINAGAFDLLNPSRATLRVALERVFEYASLETPKDGGQNLVSLPKPFIEKINDDPLQNINLEYEELGMMISSTPLKYKNIDIKDLNITSIQDALVEKEEVKICAIVKSLHIINTKKGEPMCFLSLLDESGEIEAIVFPKIFKDAQTMLRKNNIVILKGIVQRKNEEVNFIVNEVNLLED